MSFSIALSEFIGLDAKACVCVCFSLSFMQMLPRKRRKTAAHDTPTAITCSPRQTPLLFSKYYEAIYSTGHIKILIRWHRVAISNWLSMFLALQLWPW